MLWYTYVIKSSTSGRHYIGSTNNFERRLEEHNLGKNKSTRSGVPWDVIYTEQFKTRTDAVKREFKIKSFKGGNGFKKLIKI